MFQALLAHPQEVLHKRHLVYCERILSVDCIGVKVELQPGCSQLIPHARTIPSAAYVIPPEDEQVMLETCRDH
jgi:hypothetical protein